MHRTDRFFFRPFSRWFPARLLHIRLAHRQHPRAPARGDVRSASTLLLAAVLLGAGCTLITDVDRSKIPAAEVIPPPATPDDDADGGSPPSTEGDAGSSAAPDADAATALVGDAG
jgi:hypothetical protein